MEWNPETREFQSAWVNSEVIPIGTNIDSLLSGVGWAALPTAHVDRNKGGQNCPPYRARDRLIIRWVGISSSNGLPEVSLGVMNHVYFIGAGNNKWALEALNRDSDVSTCHYVIGENRCACINGRSDGPRCSFLTWLP